MVKLIDDKLKQTPMMTKNYPFRRIQFHKSLDTPGLYQPIKVKKICKHENGE